jgi:hypothetical protein
MTLSVDEASRIVDALKKNFLLFTAPQKIISALDSTNVFLQIH